LAVPLRAANVVATLNERDNLQPSTFYENLNAAI